MIFIGQILAKEVFIRAGVNFDRVASMWEDDRYVLPSRKWIFTTFAAAYREYIQVLRLHRWIKNKNDCGNHAKRCSQFANDLHANTPNAPEAGLALGEFWHVREVDKEEHGINFAIVPRHGYVHDEWALKASDLELVWLEPQPPTSEIKLIPKEVQSCFAVAM